jgi:hypothetical protein
MQQLVLDRSGVSLLLSFGRGIASKITSTIKTTEVVKVLYWLFFKMFFILKIYRNNFFFILNKKIYINILKRIKNIKNN